jgi:hypothetical protein
MLFFGVSQYGLYPVLHPSLVCWLLNRRHLAPEHGAVGTGFRVNLLLYWSRGRPTIVLYVVSTAMWLAGGCPLLWYSTACAAQYELLHLAQRLLIGLL